MVWYSHLFQNFPQFIVVHTVKGFDIVNKAEIDVFLGKKKLSLSYKIYKIYNKIQCLLLHDLLIIKIHTHLTLLFTSHSFAHIPFIGQSKRHGQAQSQRDTKYIPSQGERTV